MTKKKKLTIITALLAIVMVVPLVTYGLLFYFVNSSDNFSLAFIPASTQVEKGTYAEVAVGVHYSFVYKYGIRDQFSLAVSGTGASWAGFSPIYPYSNGSQTLSQLTVTPPTTGAVLVIKVPENAQTGNYSVTVTATNNVGLKSSATFNYTVT